jgi:hypothetical protein
MEDFLIVFINYKIESLKSMEHISDATKLEASQVAAQEEAIEQED